MAAFDNAVSLGVEMLEIDVQLTLDGVVVVAHDNELGRITGQAGLISKTALADLPLLNNNLRLQFDSVTCLSPQEDRSFCTLDALFARYHDVTIHIDTKGGERDLVEAVSDLVEKHVRYGNTVWGNMSEVGAEVGHHVNPRVLEFMSIRRVILTYIAFYTGTLGLVPIRACVMDIPLPAVVFRQYSDYLSTPQRVLLHVLGYLLMNRVLFWHLRRRGIRVVVFVLNREEEFREAVGWGVDGIMTDYPTKLKEFLKRGDENTRCIDTEQ